MKILFTLFIFFSAGMIDLYAQDLPAYCEEAPNLRDKLKKLGPVVSVGASASSGLFAKSFPLLAANQMCIEQGSGFEAQHSLGGGTKSSFLKNKFIAQRPKIIIALDHLHHSSKGRKFNSETRKYIDFEIAMLTLDCNSSIIDCSPGGDFHFVKTENYKPIVLLGDIYAFYAVDCNHLGPFNTEDSDDKDKGCIDDYNKINSYIWQKAKEIPNLFIFPVDSFYRNLHRDLPFLYQLDGKLGNFYTKDIFWDSFHPWSEPGAQILANLVLMRLNELILKGTIRSSITIPYIKIDDQYFRPFTGVVLVTDADVSMYSGKNMRFISRQGKELFFAFSDKTKSFRNDNGDWGYPGAFEKGVKSSADRTGNNPLVIKIEGGVKNGHIVLTDDQLSLVHKVFEDPRNHLLGGVITISD